MTSLRRIAVLTGSRAEYGLLYWTIRGIHEDPDLELLLLVTGMHLSPEFGLTIQQIEADGFPICARIETLISSDTGSGVTTAIGLGTIKIGDVLAEQKPDILVLLGDRVEVLSAAVAALPLLIPVAHIHGGESTEGAIDESTRHAVTKLSHISFAATDFYANRLLQMGEERWRVHVCGAAGLEHIYRTCLAEKEEVESELGIDLSQPTLVVTQHPVTIRSNALGSSATSSEDAVHDVHEVLSAVEESGFHAVITYPNSDMGGRAIIEYIEKFQARYKKSTVRVSLGSPLYLGLLKCASVLVGNSSSGIIEAASFGLPVVNVGDRQRGRIRGANILDTATEKGAILSAIQQAMEPDFREATKNQQNPYDWGESSSIILGVLKKVKLDNSLLRKRFIDHSSTLESLAEVERV